MTVEATFIVLATVIGFLRHLPPSEATNKVPT